MIEVIQEDNRDYLMHSTKKFDLVYADMIYEDHDFRWLFSAKMALKDNGIIIVQTDYHTVSEVYNDLNHNFIFLNWCIYKQEWGGTSKRFFPRKHDDILIFAKGKDYKFYPDRIQIPKVTAGTKLDKKGTGMKTPCDVFDDLGNFMTTSKERVKLGGHNGGHNVQWQKPLKLMNRLLLPFTDEEDWILDPFLGTGTTLAWCKENNRNGIGIDNDPEMIALAKERLEL